MSSDRTEDTETMGLNGLGQLQSAKMISNFEAQDHAKDQMDSAIERHQEHVNEGYDAAMKKIEKDKAARKKAGLGALFGTIFLGPLIGTAIGEAIGGAVNDGDEAASRRFGVEAEKHGIKAKNAFEDFEDAQDVFEEAGEQNDVAENIQKELAEAGWNHIR